MDAITFAAAGPPRGGEPFTQGRKSPDFLRGAFEMLANLFAARWLGHGRAIECFLAIVAGIYGTMLLVSPETSYERVSACDLIWFGLPALAVLLTIKSFLTGFGLFFNVKGFPYSRPLRIMGAILGAVLWSWIFLKFASIGEYNDLGAVFSFVSVFFSIRIMSMAFADFPHPGTSS